MEGRTLVMCPGCIETTVRVNTKVKTTVRVWLSTLQSSVSRYLGIYHGRVILPPSVPGLLGVCKL